MRNDVIDVLKFLAETKWTYLAYVLPILLFILISYLRYKKYIFENFRFFILWLKPSFETNGTSSPEKLTAFVVTTFVYAPGRLYFCITSTDAVHLLFGSLIDAVFISVLYRIISPQQLIELKNGTSETITKIESFTHTEEKK